MSKKTRKKSPQASVKKPSSKKAARAVAKASAKKTALETNRLPAKTPAKKSARANASPAALHNAPSKKLKTPAPRNSIAADAEAASASGKAAPLSEGAKAPTFRLPRDGGGTAVRCWLPGRA